MKQKGPIILSSKQTKKQNVPITDMQPARVVLHMRPVDAVDLRVQAARVAQIVARVVAAPERRLHRAAVHALAVLAHVFLAAVPWGEWKVSDKSFMVKFQ